MVVAEHAVRVPVPPPYATTMGSAFKIALRVVQARYVEAMAVGGHVEPARAMLPSAMILANV